MSIIKNGGLDSMAKCKALAGSAVKGLERTSDNQRLETSNDTTFVAKHPTLKGQLDLGTDCSLASFPGQ